MTGYRQQKPKNSLTKCPDLVDHYKPKWHDRLFRERAFLSRCTTHKDQLCDRLVLFLFRVRTGLFAAQLLAASKRPLAAMNRPERPHVDFSPRRYKSSV